MQDVTFKCILTIDTDPLSFESADRAVKQVLRIAEKHADFHLTLVKVTELAISEEE